VEVVVIKECSENDVSLLAGMNGQLIEDERANNSMNTGQLKERMTEFLNSGYKAYFFLQENFVVGYGLCDMNKSPIYLRQFFIKREERRKHYGKEAFEALLHHLKTNEIEIDVYEWNEAGIRFWQSLGFKNQYIRMKYKRPGNLSWS
jgi:RimJ/RimL family protein N-acetyltransferase